MAGDCASFVRGLRLEATARGAAGDLGAGWGDMVPARIWGLVPPMPKRADSQNCGGSFQIGPGRGRSRED